VVLPLKFYNADSAKNTNEIGEKFDDTYNTVVGTSDIQTENDYS